MRYNDFKLVETKVLAESANVGLEAQHTLHDLQAISGAMAQIPTEKVDAKMTLVDKLEKMATGVTNFINKLVPDRKDEPQPVEPQVAIDPNATVEAAANPDVQRKLYTIQDFEAADARAATAIQKIKDAVIAINSLSLSDVEKKNLVNQINTPLDALVKEFDTVRAQRDSARSERDEAINFVKEVTGILVTLGNKVQGFRDKNTDDMDSKSRTAYKKMAVNAEKFTKTLKQALFGKILDMQEDSDVTGEEIKNFLQACADGKVINMLGVIKLSKGNIKDHVNPEHSKVFDIFVKENIFSYSPGTTSGAIGPGEMALSMMGNPAEKGKKGDLRIGDEEIEIKASAKTGGRFNSKSIVSAKVGWKVWSQRINDICATAPKDATISVTQKDGSEKLVPVTSYDGNRYNVIKGKEKEGSKYNWNEKGFKALNIEVLQPYANKQQTEVLFIDTIKSLVQNYDALGKTATNQDGTPNKHHVPFDPAELIKASVNDDGTVDMKKMNIAYSKIAYASYHLADGITTVMLLRTDNLDYTIFKNADDLVDQMTTEQVMTGGGFNWNDDQQTPTPGYMSA